MTTRALDLPVLLPRGAECSACAGELGRELDRLDGVKSSAVDLSRGLLHVRFDTNVLSFEELTRVARRVGAQSHCHEHCPDDVHDHGPLDLRLQVPEEHLFEQRLAHVTGMDCADCATKLEGALRRSEGVVDAAVNFGAATLKVTYDGERVTFSDVLRRVQQHGYDTIERTAGAASGSTAAAAPHDRFWIRDRRAQLTLVAALLTVLGFAAYRFAPSAAPYLFSAAVIVGGGFIARVAYYSLRSRSVDMNVLMSLAVIGALAIGQWSEAALVVVLFALGNVLQAATLERTRQAIRSLVSLEPVEATVFRAGTAVVVPVAEIIVGDVVLVRPGERAAVDGAVVAGTASVDQSAITGESLPIVKTIGDTVFAGSIAGGGALRVRATSTAADNTIAKIVHLVEEAQTQRAPVQGLVDRFAVRYTPLVVAGAAAVAFVPPLLGASFNTWVYRGLALLIISCPCALVISTPVSLLAGLGSATRRGVLIKGGTYLEQAASVTVLAIDKTGTLTTGVQTVTEIVAFGNASRERVLAIAAAVERESEHPVAQAILRQAAAAGASAAPEAGTDAGAHAVTRAHHADVGAVERFRALPGLGVRGDLDGSTYFVGRPQLLGEHAGDPDLTAALTRLENEGNTAVAVGGPDGAVGVIAVADPLRPHAADALQALRQQGIVHICLLTGDNEPTARAVGLAAGVDSVRAGLLPADKVTAVSTLAQQYGPVAMLGDGVNDAPALAAATIGIAMGAAGTDAALETADIALMGDDLSALAEIVALSRRTNRVIRQNIAASVLVKAVFLVLAPLGLVTLWLAVLADMGTSLAVIGNGLRLQRSPNGLPELSSAIARP